MGCTHVERRDFSSGPWEGRCHGLPRSPWLIPNIHACGHSNPRAYACSLLYLIVLHPTHSCPPSVLTHLRSRSHTCAPSQPSKRRAAHTLALSPSPLHEHRSARLTRSRAPTPPIYAPIHTSYRALPSLLRQCSRTPSKSTCLPPVTSPSHPDPLIHVPYRILPSPPICVGPPTTCTLAPSNIRARLLPMPLSYPHDHPNGDVTTTADRHNIVTAPLVDTCINPLSRLRSIIGRLVDVSLAALWSLQSHLQQVPTMATANYPETRDTIAIVNPPSFFSTVWNWVKVYINDEHSGVRCDFRMCG